MSDSPESSPDSSPQSPSFPNIELEPTILALDHLLHNQIVAYNPDLAVDIQKIITEFSNLRDNGYQLVKVGL